MLGLDVVAVRAAASYVLVAAAIVIVVAVLSFADRAGAGAVPLIHGPSLALLLSVAVPAALLTALALAAPTVRLPVLNLVIAVALLMLTAEIWSARGNAAGGAATVGRAVAPSNLIYQGLDGGQALLAGANLPGELRDGVTVTPGATLWLQRPANPVAPREPLRHRANVDILVGANGLRVANGELVAPAAILTYLVSESEQLPGGGEWNARRFVGDMETLAAAPGRRGTAAGRALNAAALALLFFSLRLLLRTSTWLAANLLLAVAALRLVPGVIVATSSTVIPDIISLLPSGMGERLIDHGLATAAALLAVPFLLGELLFAPSAGRGLAAAGASAAKRGRPRRPQRQPGAQGDADEPPIRPAVAPAEPAQLPTLSDGGGIDDGAGHDLVEQDPGHEPTTDAADDDVSESSNQLDADSPIGGDLDDLGDEDFGFDLDELTEDDKS